MKNIIAVLLMLASPALFAVVLQPCNDNIEHPACNANNTHPTPNGNNSHSAGSAIAIMITGTIDGVHTEFYQEEIWQIISDITPDTKTEKKLLSKSDKKFVRQIGKYQKNITRLQEKAEIRELNDKQASRLLKHEDRLVQLLDSRDLLDRLLLPELVEHNDFVPNDQLDSGIPDYFSQEPPSEASVPEPSTLILLALGLLFLGVARGKHTYRPQG